MAKFVFLTIFLAFVLGFVIIVPKLVHTKKTLVQRTTILDAKGNVISRTDIPASQVMPEELTSQDTPPPTNIPIRTRLENDITDGQIGNPDGDVTLVTFSDYSCGYCLLSVAAIVQLLKEDKNLNIIVKDYPVLGPASNEKAAISVAVAKLAPEKWFGYYYALYKFRPKTLEQTVNLAEEKTGISKDLIMDEYNNGYTKMKILDTRALGKELNVKGTPTYVVNGKVFRSVNYKDPKTGLKQAIAEARANKTQ